MKKIYDTIIFACVAIVAMLAVQIFFKGFSKALSALAFGGPIMLMLIILFVCLKVLRLRKKNKELADEFISDINHILKKYFGIEG